MDSVEKVVEALTQEERERLADVIQECRLRDLNIKTASLRSNHALERQNAAACNILARLHKKSLRTLDAVMDVCLETELLAFDQFCRRKREG